MARRLNVKREDVLEMETRMSGGDVALEPQTDDAGEESFAPIAYLADECSEPTRVIEAHRRDWLAGDGIAQALDVLDARSRRIVEERWLKVNDDTSGGMTLHELAAEYGVSAERIRQIEVAAMKKMRKALERTLGRGAPGQAPTRKRPHRQRPDRRTLQQLQPCFNRTLTSSASSSVAVPLRTKRRTRPWVSKTYDPAVWSMV
jgi:RNA polymerase sigma factor (sigma-70 family)